LANLAHVLLKSKKQYDNLVSNIPVGIYLLHTKLGEPFVFEYVSPRTAEMVGASVESILANPQAAFQVFHPDEIDNLMKVNQEHNINVQPFDWEGRAIVNGEIIWLHIASFPEQLEKGNVLWNGVVTDITERRKAEIELEIHRNHLEDLVKVRTEELDNANKELKVQVEKQNEFELILQKSLEKEKELNEMKSRFISTTSHEFRTPLTSVLSSTELLQRYSSKWDDDKKKEHFNRIYNSVEYLIKLLDNILTVSKTDSGNISCNPELVDLYQLSKECGKDAKVLMKEEHEFIFNYNSSVNEFQLDPKLMRFIFSNLLSNAAKYSPSGGKIGLTINSDIQNIIIEISDEGIGIPAEEIDKVFDSFYRSKNTGIVAGTGLGLTIVKRAVELHNGEIFVKSELNKGTTFTVKIPLNTI